MLKIFKNSILFGALLIFGAASSSAQTPCFAQFTFSPNPNGTTGYTFTPSVLNTSGVTYHWTFGDGTASTSATPTHVYSQSGTYTVCLIVWYQNCSDTSCVVVTVSGSPGGPCNALFSWQTTPILGTQFANSSTGGYASVLWNFGDGSTSVQHSPTHTYASVGTYNVCLYLLDSLGAICDSICHTVIIQGGGNCHSVFNYTADSTGYLLTFNDQSIGNISSWSWSFPGGTPTTSTAQNPTVAFNASGTYQACLTVTDSVNNCSHMSCSTFIVPGSPGNCQAMFGFSVTGGTPGVVLFNDNSTGFVNSWSWDFGDGSFGQTQSPVHTYASPGAYVVCLTITANSMGGVFCTSTYCDSVLITGAPGGNCYDPAVIDSNIACTTIWQPVCGCDSITYANPCVAYYHHGITSWTNGACGQTPSCHASFQYTTTGTASTYSFFSAASSNITHYFWTFGDGGTSNQANPTHTYNATGFYQVCLIVLDSINNCSDTFCVNIQVTGTGGGCHASFNFVPDTSGLGVFFQNTSSGNPTGNYTYSWSFGDGTGSTAANPFHQYSSAGIYLVCLTITNNFLGCTDTYCHVVNVTAGNPCQPSFYMFPDSLIFGSGVVHFIGINNCMVTSWSWTFGDSTSSSIQNPIHQYSQTGWYYVCLNVVLQNGSTFQHCDSIYALRLGGTGLNEEIMNNLQLQNYPNPFETGTNISYQLVGKANVEMSVYNLLGEKVTSIVDINQSAGQYTYNWDASPYNAGLYILRLSVNDHVITRKLSLVK